MNWLDYLKEAWPIIRDIATVAWAGTPLVYQWARNHFFPWLRSNGKLSRPGPHRVRELEALIRTLSQAQLWLDQNETPLTREVQRDLWRVINKLSVETLSYMAVNSPDEEARCTALRRLSQLSEGKQRILNIVKGIIDHPETPQKVRCLAVQVEKQMTAFPDQSNGPGKALPSVILPPSPQSTLAIVKPMQPQEESSILQQKMGSGE